MNGARVGTLPLGKPLRVKAGNATLEVRAAHYLPSQRTVIVPRGGLARETVALVAVAAQPPSPPMGQGDPDSHQGWPVRTKVGLVLGAAAVVSAAVGTTFLFVRDSRARDFNDAGCGTASLTPACDSLRNSEQAAVTWVVAGMVGTAVLGGVGAYLLLWPSRHDASAVARGESPGSLLRCTPSIAGGMSLSCGGRF